MNEGLDMTEYEIEELKTEALDLIMTMVYWPGNNDEKFWDIQCNTWYKKLYEMYEQAIMWG